MKTHTHKRKPKNEEIRHEINDYLKLQICPICHQRIEQSIYLNSIFKDQRTLWVANLVTHYRHNHITSWNKCWEYGGNRYRRNWFGDYDDEKAIVNERAKRQIIRKGYHILKPNQINCNHFKSLQNTTQETLIVADKFLGNENDESEKTPVI